MIAICQECGMAVRVEVEDGTIVKVLAPCGHVKLDNADEATPVCAHCGGEPMNHASWCPTGAGM